MLYLIGTRDFNTEIKLLKIGYSDNWEGRRSQYITSNPLTNFISTREGDEVLEKLFHLRYNNYLYSDYGKEWFYYEEDIVRGGFKELQESDLLEYLWNNRKEILNLTYFRSDKLLREITNKLYSNRTRENLDYQNKYDVLWDIEHLPKNISSSEVEIFVIKFNSLRRFDERLRLYCETEISDDVRKMIDPQISIEYSNFYKSLGPSVCKAKATDIIRFFEVNEVIKRIGKQIIRGYYLLKFKLQ